MNFWKKLGLGTKIIIGIVLGIAIGLIKMYPRNWTAEVFKIL